MRVKELIKDVRHIGVIVRDAKSSTEVLKNMFDLDDEEVVMMSTDVTGGGSIYSFIPVGGTEFELIEPISEDFKAMLGDPPAGINHIAFTVTDIDQAVSMMNEKGIRLGHVTKDGILDTGRSKVAYFNPEDTGNILMEFVEPKK
jgi:methylmalonyl-CoA/ethylmalonyl-CoA epimerase